MESANGGHLTSTRFETQASFNAGSSLGIDTNDAASGFAYSSIIGNSHNGSWALGLVKLGANTLALGHRQHLHGRDDGRWRGALDQQRQRSGRQFGAC